MNLDLSFYWKLLLRRMPVMMLFILACSGLGVITAMKLPDTWSSSAKLLVERPQITQVETIETDAVEQLDVIQQKLTTRANLIDIANRFDVFENIRAMEPDEVVERMRSATDIRRSAGRNEATLMTISFEGRSGQIVSNVVNEYVTLALAESVENRVSRAENTLEFFEQEAQRLGAELDRQSARIAVFKSENSDALPEDQSYRLGRQTLLQERLARLERDLTANQAKRREIIEIYNATGRIGPGGGSVARRSPEQEQLRAAQAELENALSVYSDSHPLVIRQRALVARLEATVAAQTDAAAPAEGADEDRSPGEALLDATLAEIDNQIEFIQSDIDSTTAELRNLQGAISQSSANGIELAKLERDYENIQTRYNSAVNNLNSARMSERIESTAQGQRITVIENANVPQIPSGPDRTKIAALGVLAGLGLAGGYFMLLELLNRTVRRPAELIGRFNVTPITVIPYLETRRRRILRRSGLVAAMLAVVIGVPWGLWYIDNNYLPLEIVVQKGMQRLGLG
jgi:polysaccharide chain length determinant protein (PEP-CTERM system associated)